MITVTLADTGWEAADTADDATSLVVTFSNVTVDTPSSLTVYDDNPATTGVDESGIYQIYPFVVRSAGDGGFLARLSTPARVNVGNIAAAAAGTLTVDPAPVYVGEEETITVTFEAAGPYYKAADATDVNVVFTVPAIVATTWRQMDWC